MQLLQIRKYVIYIDFEKQKSGFLDNLLKWNYVFLTKQGSIFLWSHAACKWKPNIHKLYTFYSLFLLSSENSEAHDCETV